MRNVRLHFACLILSLFSFISQAQILVLHSQTTSEPSCPTETQKLWGGFSFLGATLSGGYRASQQLGSTGSCLPDFTPVPILECKSGHCDYWTGGDHGYWLGTHTTSKRHGTTNKTTMKTWVSRCVVCETNHEVLVRHSYATDIPACPKSWDDAWTGYSLVGVGPHAYYDFGQSSSGSGSCVPQFSPDPVVECNTPWHCYHGLGYHMWLHNKADTDGGTHWHWNNYNRNKQKVSRCRVCLKPTPE